MSKVNSYLKFFIFLILDIEVPKVSFYQFMNLSHKITIEVEYIYMSER